MASLGLPGRTRLATAAVDSMLGWMVIGSQNGGIYIFDLPENLCNLSARSQLDKFALATKDAPVLDMAVCFGLAHSDTDITSIILYESSQKRLDSLTTNQHKWLKQSSIVTSGRDGIVQRFEIVVGVQAKTTMIVESSLHMRKGQLANSPLTDSFAEIFIERRTTERVTAGSIGGLYRIAEQVYAVTFYRNRMVIKDASSQMELFSVAFAERNRRWRVHYVDGCNSLYLGFINKLQVSTCPIDLRSHLSNFRLAPGVSSLDIRGISAIQVVGANDRHIVALGGEDCVLRICELDESLEKPVKCLAQARRHSSAIRCVLCVSGFGNEFDLSDQESSRYILTAGASCELRCWRLCIGQQVTLLEWAVAPALSHDSESRIMDLAIVDVNHGQQTILVAAAYSDASICLWRLDLAKNEFVSVARDSSYAHGCCVLSLSVAKIAAGTANSNASDVSVTTTLFSGATDGRIFIWDLSQFVNDSRHRGHCCPYGYLKTIDDTSNSREIGGILQPVTVIDNVHQSGVNTIDTWVLQGTQIAIASGGDDNNLSYFTLDCADLLSQSKDFDCDIQRYENAHASSVQQLKFIDGCRLCSVGTDQRIAIWAVNGSCGIEMTFMECTQVADPSAMTLLLARCTSDSSANNKIDSVDVLVAGIGIESFKVKL
ncbi:WD repeat-containing protein 6 [Coemansia asiatica]|nr:WD repeat-containing protein 6 [Coemansia asiatica]